MPQALVKYHRLSAREGHIDLFSDTESKSQVLFSLCQSFTCGGFFFFAIFIIARFYYSHRSYHVHNSFTPNTRTAKPSLTYSTVHCSDYSKIPTISIHELQQCHFKNICWKNNRFQIYSPKFAVFPDIGHKNGSHLDFDRSAINPGYGQDPKVVRFEFEVINDYVPDVEFVSHPVIFHDVNNGHWVEPGELTYNSWFSIMLLAQQFLSPLPEYLEVKLLHWQNDKGFQKPVRRLWEEYGGAIFGKVSHLKKNVNICFKDFLVGTNTQAPIGFMISGYRAYWLHNPTLREMRARVRKSVEFKPISSLRILFIEKKTSYWWNKNFIDFTEVQNLVRNRYPSIIVQSFTPEEEQMNKQLKKITDSTILVSQAGGISMMNWLLPEDGVEIIFTNHQGETSCLDEDAILRHSISYIRTYRYCWPDGKSRGAEAKAFARKIDTTKFMKLLDLAVAYVCREQKFENCPED